MPSEVSMANFTIFSYTKEVQLKCLKKYLKKFGLSGGVVAFLVFTRSATSCILIIIFQTTTY